MSLNNLAVGLYARCEQLRAIQDLDEAVALDRESLDLRQQGHLRPSSLNNPAYRLSMRYNQFGAMQDLDETIVLS